MSSKLMSSLLKNITKSVSFLVLISLFCYPVSVCAHPQPQNVATCEAETEERGEQITIELSQVAELDKVARFTQLLAKSSQLTNLRLSKVQLTIDRPEISLVRWTAEIIPGTTDSLELEITSAGNQLEGLKTIHRESHRGYIAFVLQDEIRDRGEVVHDTPVAYDARRMISSGYGFD